MNSPVISLLGLQGLEKVLLLAVNTLAHPSGFRSCRVVADPTKLHLSTRRRLSCVGQIYIISFDLQTYLWDIKGLVPGHCNKTSCNIFCKKRLVEDLAFISKNTSTSVEHNKVRHNKTRHDYTEIIQKLGSSRLNLVIMSILMSPAALATVSRPNI